MDVTFVKKLLLPNFAVVVAFTLFFSPFKEIIDDLFFKSKHTLVVGILSAPENIEQRQSIRRTWLQLLPEISGSSYFIIGNELCDVHPVDRQDPHSCVSRPFALDPNSTADTEYTTMTMAEESRQNLTSGPNHIGWGFYVRSKIKVTKLGVVKELIKMFKSIVRVKLVSGSNLVLASATFDPNSLKDDKLEIVVKGITPVTLAEQSEAHVRLEVNSIDFLLPDCRLTGWNYGPNVITYINLWSSGSPMPDVFSEKACTSVFMMYQVVDFEKVTNLVKNAKYRVKKWHSDNKRLSKQLSDEYKSYGDIMFVDVVDVYRNLGLKMIHFYKREFWKVQHSGKWRENTYKSASYPSFPCGGGYVLSKGIADYLSENGPYLNYFQGEDVSMGIWVSSLFARQHTVPKVVPRNRSHDLQRRVITKFNGKRAWKKFETGKEGEADFAPDLCEWTCGGEQEQKLPPCNRIQLSVNGMYETWNKYTAKGVL